MIMCLRMQSRRTVQGLGLLSILWLAACGSPSMNREPGGAGALSGGGTLASGGAGENPGGTSSAMDGGNPVVGGTGAMVSSGGGSQRPSSSGSGTGGAVALGGNASHTSAAGGASVGGGSGGAAVMGGTSPTGGKSASGVTSASSGGRAVGGTATGGSAIGGSSTGGTATGGAASGGAGTAPNSAGVRIQGKQLLVDGVPFRIKGACWNPVPKGKTHPDGLDFPGLAAVDVPLMRAAHINTVRTYEPLTDLSVLDRLADAGSYGVDSVSPYGGDPASVATSRVNAVKHHRAILMWAIGNEWNYNGLYVNMSAADARTRINEVANLIRAADGAHPIATIHGELPSKSVVDAMPSIAVWGINAYRGIGFGDLFEKWSQLSSRPMFISEYGADAYNADRAAYDPESQAAATDALAREIADQCTDTNSSGSALGGTIFEWADEWWKDDRGNPGTQDVGGLAPGGGPYPDSTFNEEWWGIVDIDRVPRPAYEVLKSVYASG